mgnify:CR=1 FL=1
MDENITYGYIIIYFLTKEKLLAIMIKVNKIFFK